MSMQQHFKLNGKGVTLIEGPFHIIIEGEKRKARNARQVISIKIKFAR
jgi:hypothetical protein